METVNKNTLTSIILFKNKYLVDTMIQGLIQGDSWGTELDQFPLVWIKLETEAYGVN
jgi:hypothetical protein